MASIKDSASWRGTVKYGGACGARRERPRDNLEQVRDVEKFPRKNCEDAHRREKYRERGKERIRIKSKEVKIKEI